MIELSHICVNALRLQNKYHSVDFYKVIALPENPLVLNLINFEVIQIETKNMIVRNLLKERTLRWIVEECIVIGDILFAVWFIQLITQFVPHPYYPFIGLKGWVYIFSIYTIGLFVHLLKERVYGKSL